MKHPISEDQWKQMDTFLFNGERLKAIRAAMEYGGLDLHEASELILDRHRLLSEENPLDFKVDLKTYWDNTTFNPLFDD